MDINTQLKNIGLDKYEAAIYLTMLKIGPNPASIIAKQSKIKRPHTYNILERLIQKGFAQESVRSHIKYFHSTQPDKLLAIKQNELKNYQNHLTTFSEIIPLLESYQNPLSLKPRIRFYTGAEAISSWLDEIFQEKEYFGYFNLGKANTELNNTLNTFIQKINNTNIKAHEIISSHHKHKQYLKKISNPYYQYRIMPAASNLESDIIIFGQKIAFFSYSEGFISVIIESRELAESQKTLFKFVFNQL